MPVEQKPIFDRKLPEQYEHLIDQTQYEAILDICMDVLSKQGTVQLVQNGIIKMGNWGEHKEIQISLDNLVRKCKNADSSEWNDIVNLHFSKFPTNEAALKYIYKDYEFAGSLLKILIKPDGSFRKIDDQLIYRIDFPGTQSYLVIDFEDKFHFVNVQHINEWEQSIEELFLDALENIAKEKMEIAQLDLDENNEVFAFFSGDYAASYMIDLQKNASFAVGNLGAVVVIPTKGAAFAYPINNGLVMEFISSFNPLIEKIYNEDEYPITDDYYWYYEGKYEQFPTHTDKENRYIITIPDKLIMLLTIAEADQDDDYDQDDEE